MSENAKKEMTEIRRKLEGHGIKCEQLQNGHFRTKTTPAITFAASPSDTNAAHQARRDIRKHLGIDLRGPQKRKGSTNDFAMKRLHERTLKQMERGATLADLARLAVYENEMKRIGGWTSLPSAEVSISTMLKKGSRLMKQNHDALAAALNKLEHSDDKTFVKHLDKAADHFGKTRIAPKAEQPEPKFVPEPKPEPEPAPEEYLLPTRLIADPDETERELAALNIEIDALKDERLRLIEAREAAEANGHPGKVEVSVKVGLDDKTLALLAELLRR